MAPRPPREHHYGGYNTCLAAGVGINDMMMEVMAPDKIFGSNMGVFLKMHNYLGPKKAPCRPMTLGRRPGRH